MKHPQSFLKALNYNIQRFSMAVHDEIFVFKETADVTAN